MKEIEGANIAFGDVAAFAATALEVLHEDTIDLVWTVDLTQWRGPAENPTERVDDWWGQILTRFEAALVKADEEERYSTKSYMRMMIKHNLAGQGVVSTVFRIPFPARVQRFMAGVPPIGGWLLVPKKVQLAPENVKLAAWWYDFIPFAIGIVVLAGSAHGSV